MQQLLRLIKGRGDGDDFVRRNAIYLLGSLVDQVDGEQKELVGDLGAIEVSCFLSTNNIQIYSESMIYYFLHVDNFSMSVSSDYAEAH